VAGGSGGESVCQPAWDPASGRLYFVSDRSGWYNIYVVEEDGSTRSEGLWA
jgi:Tol biopolymer transport system component